MFSRRSQRRGPRASRWAVAVAAMLVTAGWFGAVAPFAPAPAAGAPSAAPAGPVRFAIVPDESTVTYRVGETFVTGNRYNLAVGTTHAVSGDVYVDRAHPQASRVGPVTVDISTFRTDNPRRDDAIRHRWLESSTYPTAVFTCNSIRGLPAVFVNGLEVPVQLSGDLRVRTVTKPVVFSGTVTLSGNRLSGRLQTSILMTDFGFDPPSILGALKAEDQAQLEIQFTARPPEG